MEKFAAIKIHSDSRSCPDEQKLAFMASNEVHQDFMDRYVSKKQGGWGFHECMNFEIPEDGPSKGYLPPTARPGDLKGDYLIFSFSYSTDLVAPSSVLGVHGRAQIISKEGIPRVGIPKIEGLDTFTYNFEADPNFVTLFSRPLAYDKREGIYTNVYARWGFGLRYIERSHASRIIEDALSQAKVDVKGGTKPYRLFAERGIRVLERIRESYELSEGALQVLKGSSLPPPDRVLGQHGERLIYERELDYVRKAGWDLNLVSWIAQSMPNSPYDIKSARKRGDTHEDHYIEVKSTTAENLSNIYLSQLQIDFMKQHINNSSLIILLFDPNYNLIGEWTYSIEELRLNFRFDPIKFRLTPFDSDLSN